MDVPPCEVCGKPATSATLDTLVHILPCRCPNGKTWPRLEAKGGYRVRCQEHPYYMKNEWTDEYHEWQRGKLLPADC